MEEVDEAFWHHRWATGEIGFHRAEANPMLVRHFLALDLRPGARVFVPLCGKTRVIHWLRAGGYRVAGSELSAVAVGQLFAELGEVPQVTAAGALRRFEAGPVSVLVGNIFDLDRATLGVVDAVYDRAALVAMPEPLRAGYAAHLMALTGTARQLLVSLEYDQALMAGPPFSVVGAEIRRHYDTAFRITPLEDKEVEGGLKNGCPARQTVWLLEPR